MTWKFSSVFSFCFFFAFSTFLAVHYTHMKSPAMTRGIASEQHLVKPWYDASFKL